MLHSFDIFERVIVIAWWDDFAQGAAFIGFFAAVSVDLSEGESGPHDRGGDSGNTKEQAADFYQLIEVGAAKEVEA